MRFEEVSLWLAQSSTMRNEHFPDMSDVCSLEECERSEVTKYALLPKRPNILAVVVCGAFLAKL
jgi:hypothetical protein